MKAKEYFEKYEERIMKKNAETVEAIREMVDEFLAEAEKLIEERHVKLVSGLVGVYKQQNQKWNALCEMFIKKHGTSVLKRDALKFFVIEQVPELSDIWR